MNEPTHRYLSDQNIYLDRLEVSPYFFYPEYSVHRLLTLPRLPLYCVELAKNTYVTVGVAGVVYAVVVTVHLHPTIIHAHIVPLFIINVKRQLALYTDLIGYGCIL